VSSGDLRKRSNIAHHFDGDIRNISVTWRNVASVAWPPHVVYLRGYKSEVESNGGCGEAPARLCLRGGDCEAAYERSGSDSFTQIECIVASALQRRVLQRGGFLGAVHSVLYWFSVNGGYTGGFARLPESGFVGGRWSRCLKASGSAAMVECSV
jgi:hypothetical protein